MNPYESEGNSYGGESNDFNTTLTLAKRAKEKGMREKSEGVVQTLLSSQNY